MRTTHQHPSSVFYHPETQFHFNHFKSINPRFLLARVCIYSVEEGIIPVKKSKAVPFAKFRSEIENQRDFCEFSQNCGDF